MIDICEASVSLQTYFGRCMAANYAIPLETLGLQNLFTSTTEDHGRFFDPTVLQCLAIINTAGPSNTQSVALLDRDFGSNVCKDLAKLKFVRVDKLSDCVIEFLDRTHGLERLIFIGHKQTLTTTPESIQSPDATDSSKAAHTSPALGKRYIEVVARNHGSTLRCLLLSNRWILCQEELARLVRSCPNLEQLGLSLQRDSMDVIHLLLPFLKKIRAIRLLQGPCNRHVLAALEDVRRPEKLEEIGRFLWQHEYESLQFVGVGDVLLEIGGTIEVERPNTMGERQFKRVTRKVPVETARHLELWAMDNPEL